MSYLRLDEVCNLKMGQSPDSGSYNQERDGIPFFQGNADFGEMHPVTRTWCNNPTKVVDKGTLLISVRAPIGALNFAVEKSCIGRGLAGITAKNEYDLKYIYYALKYKNRELKDKGTGSTFKAISKSTLGKVLIRDMTIENQRECIKRLDLIYKIFVLKKEKIRQYDELIKSRFIEMFGYDIKDCDQSEQVKEIANVRVGIVIQPTQYYTSKEEVGIKAFRSANVRPFMVNDSDWVYFDPESHSRMSKTHIHSNEVLIVRSGANLGQSCVVPEEYEGSNAIDILIVKVDEEKILPGFFCAFVNFPMGRMQILDGQRGGAQKHLNVGVFEKARIPIPSIEKQREFVSFVEAIDKSKFATQKALTETQQLFDSLMQKYFG